MTRSTRALSLKQLATSPKSKSGSVTAADTSTPTGECRPAALIVVRMRQRRRIFQTPGLGFRQRRTNARVVDERPPRWPDLIGAIATLPSFDGRKHKVRRRDGRV